MGEVLEIYIAKEAAAVSQKVGSAELVAGRGVVGDRYYNERGTFSERLTGLPDRELTLIESENIDLFNADFGFNFTYGDFRRNIVTADIRLNELEGKEFLLGSVRLRGIRLCEPCAHLANLLVPEVLHALVHRSGLRVQIVTGGRIAVGDRVVEINET